MSRISEAKTLYLANLKRYMPAHLMIYICQCTDYYSLYTVNGIWYCSNCDRMRMCTQSGMDTRTKKRWYKLQYLEECDVCEQPYLVTQYPDNDLMCPSCKAAN